MFDAFKSAGALAGLLKNKEAIKEAMDRVKARLPELRATGQAGGGAVRVTASGALRIIEIHLDPALAQHALANSSDRGITDLAANLIAEATNEALRLAQGMAEQEVRREAKALGLPDMPGMGQLLG